MDFEWHINSLESFYAKTHEKESKAKINEVTYADEVNIKYI